MKVDSEFKDIIPPLTEEEYSSLEESLLKEGCREKLITWKGKLVDGHNRYELCTKHALSYDTREIDLPDRAAALDWIVGNQLGRRNLTPEQSAYLRGSLYNREKLDPHRPKVSHCDSLSTRERLAAKFKVGTKTIQRDAKFAEAVDKLNPDIKRQVLTRESGLTRQQVIDLANHKPLVTTNSGCEEWYTPPEYIEAARQVMGEIDLDPASSDFANRTVKASRFYTKEDDGLRHQWEGRVWLNPPYTSGLVDRFIFHLLDDYKNGSVTQGCCLVNNCTETKWFQSLASGNVICFPSQRIRFISPDKRSSSPTQGQAVIYLGDNHQNFSTEFRRFGLVVQEQHAV